MHLKTLMFKILRLKIMRFNWQFYHNYEVDSLKWQCLWCSVYGEVFKSYIEKMMTYWVLKLSSRYSASCFNELSSVISLVVVAKGLVSIGESTFFGISRRICG